MTYIGSENVAYKMFYKDSLLFEGTDFRPSPLFGLDSLKSICSLLSSLTTKFGDTDRDYFANYTKDQLLFTETEDCENIRLLLSDFDSKEDDYFQEANEELTKAFIQ